MITRKFKDLFEMKYFFYQRGIKWTLLPRLGQTNPFSDPLVEKTSHGRNIHFTRVVVTLDLLEHQTLHSQNKFFFPSSLTFFPYFVYFSGKMEFFICTKTFFMDKTRAIGKKRLFNELVLIIGPQKVCLISIQFDNYIESYRVHRHRCKNSSIVGRSCRQVMAKKEDN